MKLLFCPYCNDVFKLTKNLKPCQCGKNYGRYIDNINAEVSGDCVVLGFDNKSLVQALRIYIKTPEGVEVQGEYFDRKGPDFTAFVIPENVPTVKRNRPNAWLEQARKKFGFK